jgi:uncharacterized protein YkwD
MIKGRISAILAVFFLLGWVPPAGAGDGPEALLIAAVNAERAQAGLAPLVPEARLACAARAHARDLAASGRFSHAGSDGGDLSGRLATAGYVYAMAAENLALAGAEAAEVVALWRASPGHARNMRAAGARAAGAARERGADGRYLWVLVVGAEQAKTAGLGAFSSKCGGNRG